jgi:hypothetical protein
LKRNTAFFGADLPMAKQALTWQEALGAGVVFFAVGMFGGIVPYLMSGNGQQLTRLKIKIFSALNCFSGGVLLAAGASPN